MKFEEIEQQTVYPGEYLLHAPTQQIVLVGAFIKTEGKIRSFANGKLLEDEISNFKKIVVTAKQLKKQKSRRRSCGGCKKR
jgi:hypothetical protein|tara:strand:- start:2022 stop:2264 length:243 start_codon:yes stop_codon:yes gene_type:complete